MARTGESIVGDLAQLAERYPTLADHGERHDARALAVVPLPGVGSPLGGLVVYVDDGEALTEPTRRLLDAVARRTSEAVRRVRVSAGRGPDDPAPEQTSRATADGAPSGPRGRRPRRGARPPLPAGPALAVGGRPGCRGRRAAVPLRAGHQRDHARRHRLELVVHLEAAVLTVVVRDIGATARPGVPATYLPIPEDDDPLRVFGRGLTLVDAIADRWGSQQDSYGTTAWFVMELDRDDEPARTG